MKERYFGVMLDMSRNAVMKAEEVKKFATVISKLGYNMIQLYTEDTYEIDGEPYFGYMRGRYTKEELKDIVSYCNGIGVEVIPCIQTLAHLNCIFKWPAYDEIIDCNDILYVGQERTYELIEKMFKTMRECFTTDAIHIGMDEAHMVGLGRYLDKYGYKKRSEILIPHLTRVSEIAKKYNFKPMIWSDMFFKLANKGSYDVIDGELDKTVIENTPEEVGLVYWNYYNTEKEHYTKFMKAHKEFKNDVWFAGGAWSWIGFAPDNKFTLESMLPAMEACRETGVDKVIMTMWGDNGKECSFYSLLPSLYAVKRYYDGERDINKIKGEFKAITGEEYEHMTALDLPNAIGEGGKVMGYCKHALYSDVFNGYDDLTFEGDKNAEYKEYAERLKRYAKESKNYGYVYEYEAELCNVLSIKYNLGLRTRKAYKEKNISELKEIAEDYKKVEKMLEKFHKAFERVWYKENKPEGFDIQDQRLGGLIKRINSCRKRLVAFIKDNTKTIPELETELLDFYDGKNMKYYTNWSRDVSVNVI